jgi:hypothetical protein
VKSPEQPGPGRLISVGVVAGAGLGALILVIAEFTTLFELKTGAAGTTVRSIGTGSHHAYALVPVALLVALLAFGVWRVGSRPALLAIGVLGVLALLIGLLGDLPDAHKSGLIATAGHHYATAAATPSAGLYMETLGAVVLVITSVCGFLVLGPPIPPGRRRTAPPSSSRASRAS